MRWGRVLIAAVVFLGVGLWLLFNYCQGNAGVEFGDSLSGNKVSLDLTTIGVPMLVGLPLVLLGVLLMLIAFVAVIVLQFRRPREIVREDVTPRREIPFEE